VLGPPSYWSETGLLIKEKGVAQRCDQQSTGPQNRLSRRLSRPLSTSCHGCSRRATRSGSGPASPEGWSVSFGKSRRTTTSFCMFFLAVASGQPIPVRYVEPLPRSEEQLAVARGHATPEQKAMAKKQRRFVVVKRPYYPTPEDWMEAVSWLSDRGFGQAPKKVTAHFGHRDHSDRSIVISEIGGS